MAWSFNCLCRSLRHLSFIVLAMPTLAVAQVTMTVEQKPLFKPVDKILVLKAAHQLQLLSHGETVKTYHVSLGKHPRGAKEREGDERTPEGIYWVDWRKVSDRYTLSLHISYPNTTDAAHARSGGWPAGGMIMIHGTPVSEDYPEWYFGSLDWTDGCIALANDDVREVWSLVKDNTMVEIRP